MQPNPQHSAPPAAVDLDIPMAAPPSAPPKPRAPGVLKQREASMLELAALNAEIGERALAAAEGKPGGRDRLAALHEKIRAVTFEIDCNAAAHELAQRLDKQAVADWKSAVLAMPAEDIVVGVDAADCCGLCSPENGCVITAFGPCGHPRKVGALSPRHQGNADIRQVYIAASKEIKAIEDGEYDEEEETEE
jgi:hypothetical protein